MKGLIFFLILITLWRPSCSAECDQEFRNFIDGLVRPTIDKMVIAMNRLFDQNRQIREELSALNKKVTSLEEHWNVSSASHEDDYCQDSFGGELVEDLGRLTLVKTPMTWEASKKHCEAKGMKLMEDIHSRQHFRLIWNAFKTQADMWVGAKGRKWLTTGEDVASNLYKKGHPDGGPSQCIFFNNRPEAHEYEGLGDYSCTVTLYFICQSLIHAGEVSPVSDKFLALLAKVG